MHAQIDTEKVKKIAGLFTKKTNNRPNCSNSITTLGGWDFPEIPLGELAALPRPGRGSLSQSQNHTSARPIVSL